MAREPLLLIAAFFTFFALAILYVRLDFAITKDEGTEVRLKVAGYCEKVSGHQVSIGEGRVWKLPNHLRSKYAHVFRAYSKF